MRIERLRAALGGFLLIFPFGLKASGPAGRYEKTDNGIIVHIAHPRPHYPHLISIQAVTDQIIHVQAFPTDADNPPVSLMTVKTPETAVRYEVLDKDGFIRLSTDSLRVLVDKNSGRVTITDVRGRVLLGEAERDRPVFSTDSSLSVTFKSPKDESLYGLGQQQNGWIDLKGKSLTLLQQNSNVAVPFLVSSRNYGLLWDNYSITRFGDLRAYGPLSELTLKGENGQPGGLTATYANGDSIFTKRQEQVIDYKYLPDLGKLPKGYTLARGLVRWKGSLTATQPGLHQFMLYFGGYVRVWVNGKLLLDRWRQCWNPETAPFSIPLGEKAVPIDIEWRPDGTESYISLTCLPPGPGLYKDTYSFSSEVGDAVNYFFIKGNNPDQVISGYRLLTGKAPIMPVWAMGLWQSRERYKTQEELLHTVRTFRAQHIPLDNIVLDWQYWRPDQWGSQEFDPSRFPEPDEMLRTLHDSLHTHFMISVWPKFYTGTQNFDLFQSKGWLYTLSVNRGQKDWLGYVSTFYDAFNPDARRQFWQLMNQHLFTKGVDGWWMDATEPDIMSNTSIQDRKALMEPHALGTASRYFNAFPLENARAVYEGQRATDDQRVFILTRSAYAGQQRYSAATWSGDIAARWHDMRNQITAGLGFSLSGIPYWTMDIGGFAVEGRYEHPNPADLEEWRELNTRWFQFGAFCPLLRVHGQYPYREVFHLAPTDHPAFQSILYYDRLRYRLLPYIYSTAARTWSGDYTIMRALVMDFEQDSVARGVADEYLFGPSLLVNPVCQYKARSRSVYLPAGTDWYDAYTGNAFHGGQRIDAPAPYERMPLFARAGSIVPLGPALEYTGEKPADTITLCVYRGADAAFTLYEDEGTNYHYEKGAYAEIPLQYNEHTGILTIGERKGDFPGMLQHRVFRVVWIGKGHPAPLEAQPGTDIPYDGQPQQIKAPI
ncbi:TIM-barrel domain-containing protein [Dinghuibacter silviterrae]|uniref:Alpha-D-xyloside xylohydrolase n=1 Tax=Dinghuibacter silviterrae TaxID=1539049 RepID=A0A4R8DK74_9BACT|nr:TIM-barrel domain-containing protein [Dinghuibacter silviterrae]TDW97586.1 alpha-D-xyloside xylohydrolase [Dinghuibacter silviterrae]